MSYTTDRFGNRITDLSINTEVPSLDPASSEGATPSLSLTTTDTKDFHTWPGSLLLVNGRLLSNISNVSIRDEAFASVDAELPLYRTNVHRTIRPMVGGLGQIMTYLGSLVDLVFTVQVNPPVNYILPGYEGNLWTFLKHFLIVHGLEPYIPPFSPSNQVHFRAVRQIRELPRNVKNVSRSLSDNNLAKYVDVNYYNHRNVTDGQVYPAIGSESAVDQTVFQVEAGETLEVEIQLSAWLSSVNQPAAVDLVDEITDWSGTNGRYCIAGGDGTRITAAAWTGEGGNLSLKLTDDPAVLQMRLVGPRNSLWAEARGPFSVAAAGYRGNVYSSLRITGTGVTFHQETVRIATGAGGPLANEDVGATVDNPVISTRAQAFDLGIRTAQTYGGASYTIDRSYGPHDEVTYDYAGLRMDGDRAKFRARSATYTQGGVNISGEIDTLIRDFNTVYTGKTFADFNAANAGMTFGQWAAVPLNE